MDKYVGIAEKVSEIKELKYLNALKVIQEQIEELPYPFPEESGFAYFVDGVIKAIDDWSEQDEKV